ncbi:MAG: D-tyrosyl-tRNA(Tyr) deacylase [Acidobacteria bacterium]|nr:MAG: D-tyrosyl-tRNA(Tyr) deacylase [Acidobacteriota bacterium]
MKLVIQRVSQASVSVNEKVVGAIGRGLLVFLCVEKGDTSELTEHYASKISELRIFGDEEGKMNRSIIDVAGDVLLISQFTLAADAEKGRRPSFDAAAPADQATKLYEEFATHLRNKNLQVATGIFGAYMAVSLINDGPVTILLGKKS